MSDSIWKVSSVNNQYSYLNQNVHMSKTTLLNTLVGTMFRINDASHAFYTVEMLAEMAYNEVHERTEQLVESSFPSKEVAIEAMISEYRKRKNP